MNNKHTPPPRPDLKLQVKTEVELMTFLLEQLPHKNRNNVKTLLRDKQILVNGKIVTQFNHPLLPENQVEIRGNKVPESQQYKGINIVFEDHYLIVIDKEAGILSIATDTEKRQTAYSLLSDHVKKHNPNNKIFVVHRLDRETSGLMIFAKNENVKNLLQETWVDTVEERTYLAMVQSPMKKPEGKIESYLHESKALIVYSSQNPNSGQKAITHYKTLKSNTFYTLLQVNLETGRKNQIRVHLQEMGHPIIGDQKYGSKVSPINRLGLHAWVLAFAHPITKEAMRFETEIPKKFSRLV